MSEYQYIALCPCGEGYEAWLGRMFFVDSPCRKCGRLKSTFKLGSYRWKSQSTWWKPWTWGKGFGRRPRNTATNRETGVTMERKTIRLEVSMDNEGTAAPYWLILDPRQMMSPDPMALSGMITGPFFSREEADAHLQGRRYNFSRRAVVWCASGCWSEQYKVACQNADISK